MAWSDVQIANLAISHLGSGKQILSFDEKSNEARACKQYYELIRDSTLRGFPWPFATKIEVLNLIEENPSGEWRYSYQYPVDALYARRILSGFRQDNRESRIPFKIFNSATGKRLYTDKQDAELEYTLRIDSASQFESDFVMAFSLRLGFYIAPQIVGSNAPKVRASLAELYKIEIGNAMSFAANEEALDLDIDSVFMRIRG